MSDQATRIRPIEARDIDAVADLFASIMLAWSKPATNDLRQFLRQHFIDGPFADPALPSLVFEQDNAVEGFIGVTAQDLATSDRSYKAAIACALMVRDHAANPLAGARLLRAMLAGTQDLTLTETAGDETLGMLRSQGGVPLPQHSMTWLRVLHPARFAVDFAARRLPPLGITKPLARFVDSRKHQPAPGAPLKWSRWVPTAPQKGISVQPISPTDFFDLTADLTQPYDIRPHWSDAGRAAMLAEMQSKRLHGELQLAKVATASGRPLAVAAYYLTREKSAHLLQLLARHGQEGIALDALFTEAHERDAIALQGRTDPRLMNALLGRRVFMVNESSSVVHSRNAELVDTFVSGRALMNGLVGERWSRLVGDRFD